MSDRKAFQDDPVSAWQPDILNAPAENVCTVMLLHWITNRPGIEAIEYRSGYLIQLNLPAGSSPNYDGSTFKIQS